MKLAAFFNTDEIGGAERSFVQSLKDLNVPVDVFVPCLSEGSPLIDVIRSELPYARLIRFRMNSWYYKQSRKKHSKILLLLGLCLTLLGLLKISLKPYQAIWLNGNKVALPLLLMLIIKRQKLKPIWHLRDYFPYNKIFGHLIKKLGVLVIANSKDVAQDFQNKSSISALTLYNSPPINNPKPRDFQGVIGFASMLTPWKGIHDALWGMLFYENELVACGYKTIKIYGSQIYHTQSESQSYEAQLIELAKTYKFIKVEFVGFKSPDKIFSEIDIVIHSSLKPEPFGRVIVEAFAHGVCVVSTALGGARELIHSSHAWEYHPYHPRELFDACQEISEQDQRQQKIQNAYVFNQCLKREIELQYQEVKLALGF